MRNDDPHTQALASVVKWRAEIDRRRFLSMTGGVALFAVGAGALSACGSDEDDRPAHQLESGTIRLGGYPQWIGDREISTFEAKNPGSKVDLVSIAVDEDRIAKLATDPGAVDFMLLVEEDVQRVIDLGVAAKVDLKAVPNYQNVDKAFRIGRASDKQARCVATDYGKVGFAYRRDRVKEPLTSWADLWDVAPKYSGRITFLNFPQFVMGTALIANGESVSSTDESVVRAAADRIIDIKPHLARFVETDLSKGLVEGSVDIAMDWDYDVFLAEKQDKNIVWVAPEDGMHGYLDTWVPINRSDRLPVVWDFFNHHYEPRQYANFVNTLSIPYCMSKAERFISPGIVKSPITNPPPDVLARVQYQKPLGEAQQVWDQEWQRIKAA